MTRKRFDDLDCSVACALDQVGDWWSLLVVKEAMLGTRRFVDFQQRLGIAKNILCNRLNRLVDNGVMSKVDAGEHGTRYEYRLTDKGRDLFTVITALRQWSERWNGNRDDLRLVDRISGHPIRQLHVEGGDGQPLTVRDVRFENTRVGRLATDT
ncbi:Putative transcriptional regulator family [Alloalcanivorax dieselolei B5]|uniref:Putative transcriptional regulator family n=1 Tax=Alcanivorax dieselolei (strain DSM 16502 / CGMCC 1.3690 / MCCC 1A00001 / B-5) TaxID=930169 RepID=K0CCL9_ALCDB|nr:helix-turn-helix domain-containing protein [Alloalcanivorax dieselolei]AFT69271.1 Putative transcriptional regulator family [Alloalcanivorax dieselolei B5]GGJ91294.1 transcriptional regulator [Alloalcanivorax dieselolei]